MEATIIREMQQLPALGPKLAHHLTTTLQPATLSQFSATGLRAVASALLSTTCQTRNLLHYKHLEERVPAERCLNLLLDTFLELLAYSSL